MIKRYTKNEIFKISKLIEKSSLLSGYTNKFLGGEEIQKFENEFAKFHGCKYGISVNSGSTNLFVIVSNDLKPLTSLAIGVLIIGKNGTVGVNKLALTLRKKSASFAEPSVETVILSTIALCPAGTV